MAQAATRVRRGAEGKEFCVVFVDDLMEAAGNRTRNSNVSIEFKALRNRWNRLKLYRFAGFRTILRTKMSLLEETSAN